MSSVRSYHLQVQYLFFRRFSLVTWARAETQSDQRTAIHPGTHKGAPRQIQIRVSAHIVLLAEKVAASPMGLLRYIYRLLYGTTTTSAPPPMRPLLGTLRWHLSRRIGRESRRSHAAVPERNLVGTGESAYHTASIEVKETPDGSMTCMHAPHPGILAEVI
ncbi:hypothetical protein BC827DRAFT_43472 [Russula dissimulans]|nr:hypothetical protein BC827DRAFT_43472 [Russula dissimulans]